MSHHLSFDGLRSANSIRSVEWMGNVPDRSDLLFASNELAGETGEACNKVKKIERHRRGIVGGVDDFRGLAEELADVVICADRVAAVAGIDLGLEVHLKFNSTSEKYSLVTKLPARTGVSIIAAERQRQLEKHDWSEGHDDTHDDGELASAAACYAMPSAVRAFKSRVGSYRSNIWPFEERYWKPTPEDRVRELAKAGALIAAEIDRLLRIQNPTP